MTGEQIDLDQAGPLFSADGVRRALFCIDTSTLIYLDRIALLGAVCQAFSPATLALVLDEFGSPVNGLSVLPVAGEALDTDDALLALAQRHRGVLLSEDGPLLRRAGRMGLDYYNTLLLICGLCYHGILDCGEGAVRIEQLLSFARYSDAVLSHGCEIFRVVRRYRDAGTSMGTMEP